MTTTVAERLALLKEMALFREISDSELEPIAANLHDYALRAGELLFAAGERPENFYLLVGGKLLSQQIQAGQRVGEIVLEPGDTFGAEELLTGSEDRASAVSALENARLLYMTGKDFKALLAEQPQVESGLRHLLAGRHLLSEVDFDFLGADETVHYAARKHIGYLWFRFTRSMVAAILGMLAFYFAIGAAGSLQFYLAAGGGLLLFAAVGLGIWEALDWRNDYYLITNQRVVWLEQVLLRSASRIEAPLANIQSVNLHTSLMGRLLGFGDIIVRTYTGTVLMPSVSESAFTKYLIEEYAARTKKLGREARHETIRQAVRESLGLAQAEDKLTNERPTLSLVDQTERFSLFKTRTIQGERIIYHKHWFSLVSGLTLPALFTLAVLIGMPYVFSGFPSSLLGWLVALAAFFTPLGVGAYRLLDWQNDIYVVTSDTLIDTEKRPLGSEVTKSAPIANVLSLENHKVGILGLLLNFGVVRINVGDTALDFENVADPAQVQQDIFSRMEALKVKAERNAADDERRRMTEWLRTYEEERDRHEPSGDQAAVE